MIFLIEYNRSKGSIITFRNFDDSHRREAEDSRLGIELDLNRKGIDHEVVLLDAANEDALRRTHRRYFEDLRQILEDKRGQESGPENNHRLTAGLPGKPLAC
jgi:hypothetical protein